MFYIQKIERESDVQVGDKVMFLVDGAGKSAGDKGTITEVVRGGLTIAWEGDYSRGRRPEFDVFTSDEFEFLALGSRGYPYPKKLIVRQRNKNAVQENKIQLEEITRDDEQRCYNRVMGESPFKKKDPEAILEERGYSRMEIDQILCKGHPGANGSHGGSPGNGAGGGGGTDWQPLMDIKDIIKPCGCQGPCHL